MSASLRGFAFESLKVLEPWFYKLHYTNTKSTLFGMIFDVKMEQNGIELLT